MSTENPVISNFDGLESLEELTARLRVNVRFLLAANPDCLEPDSIIRVASHDFRKIGVELVNDWGSNELSVAAAQANLSPDDIAIAIIAEDGFLKERTLLLGPLPATQLDASVTLAGHNAERPAAMQNSERGFSLAVHLVLSNEREPAAFRPHRKGTILASAMFQVRSTRDTGGLDPKPLTEDKIAEFGLTKHSVLYVHNDEPLLHLEHLQGELDIYVSEPLLAAASQHRGGERDAIIGGLAIEAMCQLVYMISRELDDGPPPEGDSSAVLRMIRRSLKDTGLQMTQGEIADLVKSDPHRVAGLLSGLDRRSQRLLAIIDGDEDEQGDRE